MGENEHRIVICNVFTESVFLYRLSVRNVNHNIRPFGVHNIDLKELRPAVVFDKLLMLYCRVTLAAVSRVALYDRTADLFDHRPHKVRTQEILVSLFTRMEFYGDVSGELLAEKVIELNHFFGGDFSCEKYFGFHIRTSIFGIIIF